MKKIIFACLLILLIMQTSIFVAFATTQNENISLDLELSSYDYFGESYKIDVKDNQFNARLKNSLNCDSYLSFYLFSPTANRVNLWLYTESADLEEVTINFKQGESVGIHLEPGPDGGLVMLDDTTVLDKALAILKETQDEESL